MLRRPRRDELCTRSRMRPSYRSLRGALSVPVPGRNRARELLELKGGEFLRIEALPHDMRTFDVGEIVIHLGEVLGDKMVSDPHPVPLFYLLKPPFQGQETSQFSQVYRRKIVEETLPLGDEIGDICRVLCVVLVPPAVQELTVLLDRSAGDEDHGVALSDQILPEGLVVIRRGFDAEDEVGEALLCLESLRTKTELLEALPAVVEDEPGEKGLAGRGTEKGVMAVFGNVDAHHEMPRRSAYLALQLTKPRKPAIIVCVHGNLLVKGSVMLATSLPES